MEGSLFYWISWAGWIIMTFFYPKDHPDRLVFSAWILGAITLTTVSFPFLHTQWSGTGLFILFTIYMYTGRFQTKKLLYFFITSFIIMLVNVCFLLFELFDPVWLLIKREWLLSFVVVYLAVLLQKDKKLRILTLILGMIQGEMFYSLILMTYSFNYPVATLTFLDALALATAILFVWNSLEFMAAYIDKHINSEVKEKQKLT